MFDSEQQLTGLSNESAQRNSEVGTIHIGLGIVFVALGVVLFRRLSTITPAFLLGGVLLILLGAPAGGEGSNPLNAFADYSAPLCREASAMLETRATSLVSWCCWSAPCCWRG